MFSKIGPAELLIIGVIVLVIFGPSKLPKLGRSLGDTLRNFKEGAGISGKSKSDESDHSDE